MATRTVDTILVGLDESEAAMQALEYGIAIASAYDAEIYALEVRAEDDVDAVAAGEVDAHDAAARSEALLTAATDRAAAADVNIRTGVVSGYSIYRKSVHPGSVVVDIAEELNVGYIVVPREPSTTPPDDRGTLERAAQYALHYASQPVLAV